MTAIALPRPRNALLDRLRTIQIGIAARGAVGVGLATQRGGAAVASSLLTDLIAYWKLDETSGDAIDAHSGLTLTQAGTAGSVSGKIQTARSLNGLSAAFERGSWSSFSGASRATLSGWIKPSANSVAQSLFALWTPVAQLLVYLLESRPVFGGAGSLRIFTDGSTYATSSSTALVADGLWHYLVIRYDGSLPAESRFKVLVDGSDATLTITGTFPTTLAAGTPYLEVGRVGRSAAYFYGAVDEIGIWSRAITNTEADLLYTGITYPFA